MNCDVEIAEDTNISKDLDLYAQGLIKKFEKLVVLNKKDLNENLNIIKNSKDTEIAKKNLLSKKWKIKKSAKLISLIEKTKNISSYSLTDEQVNAILELRLQKLTAFGINEIETEI